MSHADVADLISVRQAIELIDGAAVTPGVVSVPLMQSMGLRLAEEILADRDSPPFTKSLMDGYAVRAADVANVPCELPVVEQISAGQIASRGLGRGEAMAIMTGAPLPAGADGVVPVEQTELLNGGARVRILAAGAADRFIAAEGSDVHKGAVVLNAGAVMGPAQIAVAASVGATTIKVYRAPSVAVLGTGDEIIPIDQTPGAAQIRGSNNAMLTALLGNLGCSVRDLGTRIDDPDQIRKAMMDGLQSDVLFITGGMSMGRRDYVPAILKDMGAELRISKLRIKPGKPFVFAVLPGGKFIFGMPGNPVSAFVCTIRLAARLLVKIAGGTPGDLLRSAMLSSPLAANGPREFYQPAILNGKMLQPLIWKGSADIYTLARANALIVRPENDAPRAAGDWVDFLEINGKLS